jgi:hypothetical protein
MATCDYKCTPYADITELNTNENTYGEAFMNMNNDKIIQKIKMLMKERFFYLKKDLIAFIQVPKAYSLIQIYASLTQMIEENEVIMDRYGRSGYLVNIGEYYLFQPLELTDKHISVFDRSVPIDYKHQMIRFDLKEGDKITKNEGEREDTKKREKDEGEESDYEVESILDLKPSIKEKEGVFNEIRKRFEFVQELYQNILQNNPSPKKKEDSIDSWYKSAGLMMTVLTNNFQIPLENLNSFLIDHIIETLMVSERLELLNDIYLLKTNVERNSLKWYMKNYFMRNIIHLSDFDAIVFQDINGPKAFVLNEKTKQWNPAEPEDIRDLENSVEGRAKLHPNFENMNSIIGLIGFEKKNQYLVFKTRDLTAKRDLGARCDQAEKSKTIRTLNQAIGEERYTIENTKGVYQKEDLCVLLEFLMRYNNQIKKNGKFWFSTF